MYTRIHPCADVPTSPDVDDWFMTAPVTAKQQAITDRTYEHAVAARIDAACALHSAEIAVHDAHQTHVDLWISAANDRLHIAVTQYLAADALVSGRCAQTVAA